ncbi:MAG: RagB/SusD family nutrient uptake outer membrane protein, partial [Bacteroidetes bacterium]
MCDLTGLNANTSYVDAYYRGMHQGIRNCNFVINGMASVKAIPDNLKNRYIAEAKFLRGFFYFELVKNFGDDAINNDFKSTDATLFLPRSPKADIYKQIYKDFQD